MKELSIEEKAKAYDESYKVAESIHRLSSDPAEIKRMEEIFPELKESEDERTRERLIHLVNKSHEQGGYALHKDEAEEMIAWLKKQGKHANFPNNIQIGDTVTRNEDGVLVNLSQLKRVAKPADKIEPKFHKGEWVVSPNGIYWHIDAIRDGRYQVSSNSGVSADWPLDTNIYHRFTIQDAKDGDVLHCWIDGDEFVLIYKGIKDGYITTYSHLYQKLKSFSEEPTSMFCRTIQGHFTPATKEQRDQLEKAMADAGYTFDFEKKELKKVSNASEECEIENIKHGKYYYCIKDYYSGGCKRVSKGEIVQALRGMSMMALGVKANEYFIPVKCIVDVKSAWSEENGTNHNIKDK